MSAKPYSAEEIAEIRDLARSVPVTDGSIERWLATLDALKSAHPPGAERREAVTKERWEFGPGDVAVLVCGPCAGAWCHVDWVTQHFNGRRTYGVSVAEPDRKDRKAGKNREARDKIDEWATATLVDEHWLAKDRAAFDAFLAAESRSLQSPGAEGG